MFKLFLIFLKINFLSPSGPASVGLTKQLVVPHIVSSEKFYQILAITSGIPGSDAIQMAWQIGYASKGLTGAIVSVAGALIPCILLATLVMIGLKFVNPKVMSKFIDGMKPVLFLLLLTTAIGLWPKLSIISKPSLIILLAIPMFYFNVPIVLILIMSGFMGLL